MKARTVLGRVGGLALLLSVVTSGSVSATGQDADRVFPEPRDSGDFILHAPR